jgi:hypothetical protein
MTAASDRILAALSRYGRLWPRITMSVPMAQASVARCQPDLYRRIWQATRGLTLAKASGLEMPPSPSLGGRRGPILAADNRRRACRCEFNFGFAIE